MNRLDNSFAALTADASATPADAPVAAAAVLPAPTYASYRAKATAAAVQFESFFISQMLHQMRASVNDIASADSPGKDPRNGDMVDLADNLVADKMAGQRAFGIADVILRQLLPAAAPAPHGAKSAAAVKTASQSDNISGALNKAE
jgi:flagellar protein FlgJ